MSLDPTASLFWLLEEPLIHGARLDVRDSSRPGLSQRLVSARAVKLRHIVDAAGPRLHDVETLASRLGLRSNQHTRNILNAWTTKLTTEELEMLQDYASGAETPDEGDPFPELGLEVDQSELTGPLLVSQRVNVHMVNGKALYKLCVQALNKRQLSVSQGFGVGVVLWGSVKVSQTPPAQPATMSAGAGLERLTRRHAVKMVLAGGCSVEECSLAVGELVRVQQREVCLPDEQRGGDLLGQHRQSESGC
ncbi:hypothetical protein L3Q82_004798 [Scortum barcoo]|uniref:Uncharacterized protein n=1 Tax=Scortum barcoo TaxID=214431 RepID=A0ACB8VKE3_9TELE|nr:hypothetical protein L3Q82_004798 [Scortum barcoo]